MKITDISYTNKDFGVIYTELLDLVKQLTNKWDPSLSNESDPGVVLLKLAAFIGDKNNYNIDRNVLENFLPTASQERSVRSIVEMNGYIPSYYNSANGDVTFVFNSVDDEIKALIPFVIPAYTLTVTTEDGDITYTQAEALTVDGLGKQISCKFIEGVLNEFTVNNSNIITMENIDSNYRLYLSTKYIAQNGIFFYDVNGNYLDKWKKVDYIYTEPLGTYVYSIDYDAERELPYIQFPEDIANLISNGLVIKYLSCSGVNGNVGAGQLNTLGTTLSINGTTIPNENISILNLSSIVNGKDPETLTEMYESFKRTVGTFETLVTCKDYENAIYNLKNNDLNIVSNATVTDKRTDYNKAVDVACYDVYGSYFENIGISDKPNKFRLIPANSEATGVYDLRYNTKTKKYEYWTGATWVNLTEISYNLFTQLTEKATPYDLYIHAFKTLVESEYNYYKYYLALENTFKPATQNTVNEIKNQIEDLKCINHIIKDNDGTDVFCFKNYAPINATITTYEKISKIERVEILNNIYKALTKQFNARQLDFGEELNYDDVENCILNADARIKKINMDEFKYTPKYMLASGDEGDLYNSTYMVDLIAKNVLAGRLCLVNFDSDFKHEYGQTNVHQLSGIVSISTETKITTNGEYTLKENEAISIVSPKYVTTSSYGSYVKYEAVLENPVEANSTYTLGATESLKVTYTADGVENSEQFTQGTIIEPSFKLSTGSGTLTTSQSIAIKALAEVEYRETSLPCYWITNNAGNILFDIDSDGKANKILDENEYFIITTQNYDSFIMYGPGTILNLQSAIANKQLSTDKISISELMENGLSANFNWYKLNLFNGTLKINESNTINLTGGDKLELSDSTELSNTWTDISELTSIKYTFSSEDQVTKTISGPNWWIRSRLDLTLSNTEPQVIANSSTEGSQTITVTYENALGDRQESTITGDSFTNSTTCLLSSEPISLVGGTNIDLNAVELDLLYYTKLSNPYADSRNIIFRKQADGAAEATKYYKATDGNFTTKNVGGDVYYKYLAPVNSNVIIAGDVQKSKTEYDPSIYRALFGYEGTVSDIAKPSQDYILPIFVNYDDKDNIKASLEIIGDVTDDKGELVNGVTVQIAQYGSEAADSLILKSNTNNLLTPIVNWVGEGSKIINMTLRLSLEITDEPQSVETITLNDIKIATGINQAVSELASLEEVIERIQTLISNSDKPETSFYYINEPEKSFAINEEDWTKSQFLFDPNNVANHITISQLDLRNSKIDFSKAVRDYD